MFELSFNSSVMAIMKSTMKLFSRKTSETYDNFLSTLGSILAAARIFGISTFGLNVACVWTITVLIALIIIEAGAVWKLIIVSNGIAVDYSDERGFAARLSGSIFYGNALLSLLLSLRFISSWKRLSVYWMKVETKEGLRFPTDSKIRLKMVFVSVVVAICAFVEHMLSMMSATSFNWSPEEYMYRYILSSHSFILQSYEYSLWLAVPIFVFSKIATILWNFQDLIIILISMGLTSRYNRINLYVKQIINQEKKLRFTPKLETDNYIQNQMWRRVREAYVRQAALVRTVDQELGALMLLSNTNNLFFICLQLFLGINVKSQGTLINMMYYFMSLGWLLFRASSVVIAASDVHVYSRQALVYLYSCPSNAYNTEIIRLKYQLTNDVVALSGMGFFSLKRHLLLQVAATILKYELVMIQYDK